MSGKSNKSSSKRSWEDNYARLVAYHTRFKDCHVPYNWTEDPALSWWLSDQRKRQTRLPEDQKAKLDALGFSWENPKKVKEQQQWEEHFKLLQVHKEEKGDCNPSQTWKAGPKLTRWVARQREYYKQNVLSDDRKERLNALGFTWEAPTKRAPQNMDKNNERWRKQYEKLVAFQKEHGHTRVPQAYSGDKSLGAWIKKQREQFAKNLLSADRLALLNSIGFEWSLPDAQFMENYDNAKTFKETHGHLRFPVVSSKKLNDWAYRQRKAHSLGKLDEQRKRLLDEIGFPWETEPKSSSSAAAATGAGTPSKAEVGGGDYTPMPNPTTQQTQQESLPTGQQQQQQQTPHSAPGDDINVRKRFRHGWMNGKRVKKLRKFHHVSFSDGQEEYLSDEEFEVASFAYQNFLNRGKR